MSDKNIAIQKLGLLQPYQIQALRDQVNAWEEEILEIMEKEQDYWVKAQSFAYQQGCRVEQVITLKPIRRLEAKRAAIVKRIESLEQRTLNTYGIVL